MTATVTAWTSGGATVEGVVAEHPRAALRAAVETLADAAALAAMQSAASLPWTLDMTPDDPRDSERSARAGTWEARHPVSGDVMLRGRWSTR